ncbi:MAG: MoaD/ThiS family protein [Alphaproteobacteria bacterium]|nr:MoaD/ThiS family protein [Alphaproteobacteria bacterium]MBV9419387.1 MoaD/ThiS family protein [Alphaproteobacteria bacterium]
MTIRVQLPPVLRAVNGGERWLDADGSSIAAVLTDIARNRPALGLHLFDEAGAIRHNIVFLHNGEMIRAREAAARRLNPGDEIVITNALAGG